MTASIRKPGIDKLVPVVARHPVVREVMRERQRQLGQEGNVVIEGRDIGTVVAPDARSRSTSSPIRPSRAQRRAAERPEIAADALATDLRMRDERDAINMRPAHDAVEIDTTELAVEDVVERIERSSRAAHGGMNRVDAVWAIGRMTMQPLVRLFVPLRNYGVERVPREGGVVLAFNHFHWIDPPAFGAASPRTVYFVAKVEAHRMPGLGQLIRAFGTISIRRGESDREAVRQMREAARSGHAIGLFVEGTRQLSGVLGPGPSRGGDGRAAGRRSGGPGRDPRLPRWRPGNWAPVSIAWGEPMRFEGLPKGSRATARPRPRSRRSCASCTRGSSRYTRAGRPRHATPPA